MARTNLKAEQIQWLESGRWDAFAAPAYVRGFVRSYAQQLKLPLQELSGLLDAELGQTEKFRELPDVAHAPKTFLNRLMLASSRVNWRIALPVLVFLALVALTYVGVQAWQQRRPTDPLKNLGTGMIDLDKKHTDVDRLPPSPVPTTR